MPLNLSLLMDNPKSWFAPFADRLQIDLESRGHSVTRVITAENLPKGDCVFFLSCEKIVPPEILSRNRHNIVVHASDLPSGKGWSPMTWQILEGKKEVPVTLFEAAEGIDSGRIYLQDKIIYEGHELLDEIRIREADCIISLALRFTDNFGRIQGREQAGHESFYPRRRPVDSELDVTKPLSEQFDLLRVVDNERYPAFFRYRDHTYILKIEKNASQGEADEE